jgi:tryptophan-rich hypothetical protein
LEEHQFLVFSKYKQYNHVFVCHIRVKKIKLVLMNPINPHKLLLSKWTAIEPKQKERHFMVTKLIRAEDEVIVACELQAVISNNVYEIDWHLLKDSSCWQMGWR